LLRVIGKAGERIFGGALSVEDIEDRCTLIHSSASRGLSQPQFLLWIQVNFECHGQYRPPNSEFLQARQIPNGSNAPAARSRRRVV
jgi:hypothetical protein